MNLPRLSLRLRIALLSAAISGVVLLGFGAVAWMWLSHERLAALDREIRALAYRHPGWMNNQANYERLGSAIEFIFGEEGNGRLILAALDTNGTVRFRSAGWPPALDPASLDLRLADEPRTATDSNPPPTAREESPDLAPSAPTAGREPETERRGQGFGPGPGFGRGRGRGHAGAMAETLFTKAPRFLSVRTPNTNWRLGILGNDRDRLVVGLDGAEMAAEMGRMRWAFAVALPVALGLIGAGGWLVAGRAVRPLRRIAETAEHVTARGLDQRIPVSPEDPEIERLVAVLNRMMDRLETSFRQATRFSADASHELKTPLAVMQGELEQALQQAAEGSRDQQTYASLLEETQRLKTITRSLLLLAQADSGRMPLSPSRWDLSAELETIVDDARVLTEAAELELEAHVAPGILVDADRTLLRLVISNLLENALHYNEPKGRIRVHLVSCDGGIRLEVSNSGPGIAAEEQARVFDRFHRGSHGRDRRPEGMGLGLSLAREIVGAHGGELVLARSTPGETTFRVSLPPRRPET